ncbi:MAG TPA: M48 family peptidase [Thermococcus sp.]|nr:M48 family peptidase [Thermococcus sp.]
MNTKQLRKILKELKKELEIPENEKIHINLRPMKTKAASISLKNGTIRLNKNLIQKLDEESIKYLILHELIHYKLKNTYHNDNFQKQINSIIDRTKIKEIERKIITKLLEQNNIF